MEDETPVRRRTALGIATVAGAVGLAAGLFAALPASATGNPEEFEGNPTCGDLAPEGAEWSELKVDPVTGGSHSDGTLEVTLTLHNTDQGQTFDWASNIGVDAVFAKGGPGGNLYSYDESTGDSGLHAPVNPSGKWAGLSHISFCYDDDEEQPEEPEKPEQPEQPEQPEAPEAPPAAPVPGQPTFAG